MGFAVQAGFIGCAAMMRDSDLMQNHSNIPASPAPSALHVAFCVDDRYVPRMGATIASIVANNPGASFVFHVFVFSISDENRRRVADLERRFSVGTMIHVIDPEQFREFHHFIRSSYYSAATFTRLVVPSVLAGIADRVVYLDADILCVGDVNELRELDLQGNIVAAVPDAPVTMARRTRALNMDSELYFNAGMMLIDVPAWMAAGISEKAVEVLSSDRKDLRFQDQDALNLALEGRTRFIANKWNHIYGLVADLEQDRRKLELKGEAVFIHFAGSVKPWSEWTGHEATALFRQYHLMSPWSEQPLEEAPRNYKEMRMYSRFLFRRREFRSSLAWYWRYLGKKRSHTLAAR
jgi:UDP-glucose:(glucosyl)LPS alpha-1,3-glucosyltransferase